MNELRLEVMQVRLNGDKLQFRVKNDPMDAEGNAQWLSPKVIHGEPVKLFEQFSKSLENKTPIVVVIKGNARTVPELIVSEVILESPVAR